MINEESMLQTSTGKPTLNYEFVINTHIMRSNQLFQSVTSQKGVAIPIMMSMYASVSALDGLIRNKRQPKEYDEKMNDYMGQIKKSFDGLGDTNTDDKKFIDLWFFIMDAYNFQLRQMYDLGLTPAEDVDDILPSIVEKVGKVIEVPPWEPAPGDYDYKLDLGLPMPANVKYREEKKDEARPEKPPKPESEMTPFELEVKRAKEELEAEIAERESKEKSPTKVEE